MSEFSKSITVMSEYVQNVFGQFDVHAKKIEKAFHVSMILRDDKLKISGEEKQVNESAEVPIMQEVQKRSSGNLRLLQAFLNCSGYKILTRKNSFCASVVLKKWNSPV